MPHADGATSSPQPRGLERGPGGFLQRGAYMEGQNQKLFELLLARLAAGDMAPVYLGEFPLPPSRSSYPPVYAWLDLNGDLRLETDPSALARICVLESISAGRPVTFGSPAVAQAVDRFRDVAAITWSATKIEQAAACAELKSAKQRAALRWSAAR